MDDPAKNLERVVRAIKPQLASRPVPAEPPRNSTPATHIPNPGPYSPAPLAQTTPEIENLQ